MRSLILGSLLGGAAMRHHSLVVVSTRKSGRWEATSALLRSINLAHPSMDRWGVSPLPDSVVSRRVPVVSTIWTPGGERPVGDAGGASAEQPSEAELEAQMEQLRQELAEAPAAAVIANHCVGLFQLAALHLSLQPPKLDQAQLAIDGLGALVEGLAGRLGPDEQQLKDGLAQLRLAFVQIKATTEAAAAGSPPGSEQAPGNDAG